MTEKTRIEVALKRVAPIREQLSRRFDLDLSFNSVDHVADVHRIYTDRREIILHQHGISESLKRDDYAKAVMISEAAAMMLREIAPKRIKKKKSPKGTK